MTEWPLEVVEHAASGHLRSCNFCCFIFHSLSHLWLFKSIIPLFRVYNILFWQFIADRTNISIPKKLVSTNFVPIWLLVGVGTVKKRVCSTRNIFSTHVRVFEMRLNVVRTYPRSKFLNLLEKSQETKPEEVACWWKYSTERPKQRKKIIGLTVK